MKFKEGDWVRPTKNIHASFVNEPTKLYVYKGQNSYLYNNLVFDLTWRENFSSPEGRTSTYKTHITRGKTIIYENIEHCAPPTTDWWE